MSANIQKKRVFREGGSEPLPLNRKQAGELKAVGKAASKFLKQRKAVENVREYFECERRDYEHAPRENHIWLDMKVVIELLNELVARKQFVEGRKG